MGLERGDLQYYSCYVALREGKRVLNKKDGVTLVELLVVMTIVVFVLAAASRLLSSMIVQFKQQTKIAETSIESTQGLELLRRDIKSAGFGLPRGMPTINYEEAEGNAALYNDSDTSDTVPRALIGSNPSFDTVNDSDYLVIKSMMISEQDIAGKWHFLFQNGTTNTWVPDSDIEGRKIFNIKFWNRVIVLSPKDDYRLITYSGKWYTTFNNADLYKSNSPYDVRLVYGVDSSINLRFPFNRADYYISSQDVPQRCASGTGVLVKALLDHNDGDFDRNGDGQADEMPLLDCVADMQVVFFVDTDGDGLPDTRAEQIDAFKAADIRDIVKEVMVYVLVHEGQKDPAYQFPLSGNVVRVGDPNFGTGRNFDLGTFIGSDWRNYRWKVYSLIEIPEIVQKPR